MSPKATRRGLVFELARVTIEFTTPSLVSSGDGHGLFDAVFVADASGLPAIPGETIAGILRHAAASPGRDPAADDLCRRLFGFQEGTEGEASALRVSWAQVHGQNDRPVPFRCSAPELLERDPVLAFLKRGVARDHVRIGPHGAVDGRGKYDQLLVPAGARFSFELVLDRSDHQEDAPLPAMTEILALLARPELRAGGSGHRGLGAFVIVRAAHRLFDLKDPKDYLAYLELPVGLEDGDGGILKKAGELPKGIAGPGWVHGEMRLKPTGSFRFSGSLRSGREPSAAEAVRTGRDAADKKQTRRQARDFDRFPMVEQRIIWTPQEGRVQEAARADYLTAGSSIKGALRHRTVFHLRRIQRSFAPRSGPSPKAGELQPPPGEATLYGEAKGRHGGRPGCLLLADSWLSENAAHYLPQQHVSLDRFTCGPMEGLLFDELSLRGAVLEVSLDLRVADLDNDTRQALAAALDDLCNARLQAGAGRGHGRFRGTVQWSDGGRWMTTKTGGQA